MEELTTEHIARWWYAVVLLERLARCKTPARVPKDGHSHAVSRAEMHEAANFLYWLGCDLPSVEDKGDHWYITP